MKLGQLIQKAKIICIFKNHAKNDSGKLVLVLFLFFEKILFEVKASFLQSQYLLIALNFVHNENKLHKNLDY